MYLKGNQITYLAPKCLIKQHSYSSSSKRKWNIQTHLMCFRRRCRRCKCTRVVSPVYYGRNCEARVERGQSIGYISLFNLALSLSLMFLDPKEKVRTKSVLASLIPHSNQFTSLPPPYLALVILSTSSPSALFCLISVSATGVWIVTSVPVARAAASKHGITRSLAANISEDVGARTRQLYWVS